MGPRRTVDRFAGLPITQAALEFATARHAGQCREIDRAPFITHPIQVALLLHRAGYPDQVIAAGLLHDVLERTSTTASELRRRFGARIARLVATVSDDPSIEDYDERKRVLRNRVEQAGCDAFAIYTADKITKVQELKLLPESRLQDRTTASKLTHYRASLEMLRRVAADATLVGQLEAELARLDTAGTTKGATTTSRAPRPRTGVDR